MKFEWCICSTVLFKDAVDRAGMKFKREVNLCTSPNTKQKIALQWEKGRFPWRSTAIMYERVLAKWYLPLHRIFSALLTGKVKDNNSVLNMFRCFVTRGSYKKPELSEMERKEQKCMLCILLTVSCFTAFLKHLRRDLVGRGGEYHFKWRQISDF